MCGIAGCFPQNENTIKILPFLCWDIEKRGKQSWGVMDEERVLHKQVGLIVDTFGKFPFPNSKSIVYHTRQATAGAITAENTHPFEFEGSAGVVRGVHNGCLLNHEEMNRKDDKTFAVDSMHIFSKLAEGKDLSELHGWGAIVCYLNGVLHFSKLTATADLTVGRLKTGEIVFASEQNTVVRAAKIVGNEVATLITFGVNKLYSLTMRENNVVVTDVADLKFGDMPGWSLRGRTRGVVTSWDDGHGWNGYGGGGGGYGTTYGANDDNACMECANELIDPKRQVVCKGCLKNIVKVQRQRQLQGGEPKIIQAGQVMVPTAGSYVAN